MADQTQTYTTLRAFPHHGRVVPAGGTVQMHPSQAKYYLGTHLREGGETAPASKPAAKTAAKSTTTDGDE